MITTPRDCPVCHHQRLTTWSKARDYEYFTSTEEYIYYGCENCSTIFIWPQPLAQLKQIYPVNYYSFATRRRNLVFRIKEWLDKRFFKRVLQKIDSPELNVLDIGGGTGWEMDILKNIDERIRFTQVVDIDEKAKTAAEEKGHSYFTGTIEEFQTDRQFHLILMLNLIEHVADPQKVLEKAGALLAPGGLIMIKTPNTVSWDARLYRGSYWGGLHCPRHWVIFSEKSFNLVCDNTGLRIRQLKYTQGAPFWAFSVLAAWHRKKWIRVTAQRPIIFHPLFAPVSAFFALFDFLRRPFAKTSQLFILLEKQPFS